VPSTPGRTLVALACIALASLALALMIGSVRLAPAQVLGALAGQAEPITRDIVLRLRLPRALDAFACGALLALAGALLQVLLRNPLADPYVLGVAGGAALGALLTIVFGAAAFGVSAGAFAGALAALALVLALARRERAWHAERLLLIGAMLAAGLSALSALILTLAPSAQLRGMLFWLMGDFSHADGAWLAWLAALVFAVGATLRANALNVFAVGEVKARSLGLDVARAQWWIYLSAALATAIAVAIAGAIGFVGLMAPHVLRMLGCADYRYLIPGAALLGGGLLVVADSVGRTIVSPTQLPAGAVTALVGVTLMLWLLLRAQRASP
jgi:iron complex transport system permease protein